MTTNTSFPVCPHCDHEYTDSAISFAPDRDPEKPWQKLFTEAQVRELLAQADKDFSDGMTVVHLRVADQMRKKYEPVLRRALEVLEDNRHDVECVERSSYMRECYDPAIDAIKGVLG